MSLILPALNEFVDPPNATNFEVLPPAMGRDLVEFVWPEVPLSISQKWSHEYATSGSLLTVMMPETNSAVAGIRSSW